MVRSVRTWGPMCNSCRFLVRQPTALALWLWLLVMTDSDFMRAFATTTMAGWLRLL
jgi:hypothetical protein